MVRSIPDSERILVFQGGGSLEAYEAGAYKGIYELLKKKDNSKSIYNKSTFDIISGSSISAINATIITSHVIETGSYDGSAEKLIDFWYYLSKESMVEKMLFSKNGGTFGIQFIIMLLQEKLPEGTTRPRNFRHLAYPTCSLP